jgi:SAM-dependent methyltransferase
VSHRGDHHGLGPAGFLTEQASLLPPGRTLDLACGSGRNALFLAGRGHRVIGVDLDGESLGRLRAADPAIPLARLNLDHAAFRSASLDNLVCVNFLDRRLFSEIHRWLRPGGRLLYDTFLIDQREIGHPKNPEFLLGHGELQDLLAGYRILAYREGRVSEGAGVAYRAGAVAVRI